MFTYKRLAFTQATVEALRANPEAAETELFVFSDGPKTEADGAAVEAVRAYVRTVTGFKRVTFHDSPVNKGLSRSIIDGVSQMVEAYGRVIVMEDDLVSSPYFLRYMNAALQRYEQADEVGAVVGGLWFGFQNRHLTTPMPETYFIRGSGWLGWGTWKRAWAHFEKDGSALLRALEERQLTHEFSFNDTSEYTQMLQAQIDGKNDSWAIRWQASLFLKGKLTLHPGVSHILHIGYDANATHCNATHAQQRPQTPVWRPTEVAAIPLCELPEHRKAFEDCFAVHSDGFFLQKLRRGNRRELVFFRRLMLAYTRTATHRKRGKLSRFTLTWRH
ncbi:MAG: glycosyltransferase family 2 protein [Kiritimatiellaeota bacterium]|nr:glycosyltransferase family 2 protein [Kiritimatiellota bacterium]